MTCAETAKGPERFAGHRAVHAVLVPLDGSSGAERAIAPAARLAQLTGTPLTLFHWDFDDREAALTGSYLEMLAGGLDVPTTVEVVVEGDPVGAIVAAAERRHATVCMATQGRNGVPRAILGSVAEAVVRRLRRPTVLVGPHAEQASVGPVGRIVVCVDGSTTSEAALEPTAAWARQLDAPVELVHALAPVVGEGFPGDPVELLDSGYLQRTAKGVHTGSRPSFEVLHGDPAHAIAEHATGDVELIALATHGRSGLRRLALGSVAMEVAHRAHRPVLVVPPELV